jgi:hypothetical protein
MLTTGSDDDTQAATVTASGTATQASNRRTSSWSHWHDSDEVPKHGKSGLGVQGPPHILRPVTI